MGREGEIVGQLIPEFERRNPGVHVESQQIPWSAAHEKLLTAFVGDATPDVAQMGNTWIPEFSAIHALDDLRPHLTNSTIKKSDHFLGIWETNVVDGAVYGIPWYVDTRVMFYRSDLLADAGVLEPPKTWAAWLDAMERIKARGKARYAILLPTNQWEEVTLLALEQHATLLRDGGRYAAFEQPEFVRGFSWFADLFRRGLAPPVASTQVANIYQGFEQADFAMYLSGPWNVGEFRARLSPAMKDKWTTTPMPAPNASEWPGVSLAGGASLVIFRQSKQSDLAWKFIEFLSEPAQQQKLHELTGDLPAHRGAWRTRDLTDDREIAAFRTQLEHVAPLPAVPEWEQIATAIYETGESAIRGQKTIPRALAGLDHRADAILAKHRWVVDRSASK